MWIIAKMTRTLRKGSVRYRVGNQSNSRLEWPLQLLRFEDGACSCHSSECLSRRKVVLGGDDRRSKREYKPRYHLVLRRLETFLSIYSSSGVTYRVGVRVWMASHLSRYSSVRATWSEDVQDSKTPVYPFQASCRPPNCLRGQPSPEYYLRHGYWHVQLVQWRETWGSRRVDSRMTFRFPDVNWPIIEALLFGLTN